MAIPTPIPRHLILGLFCDSYPMPPSALSGSPTHLLLEVNKLKKRVLGALSTQCPPTRCIAMCRKCRKSRRRKFTSI